MFERFTDAARAAVVSAQTYARAFGHTEIGAEHVLLGAVADEQGVAATVLARLGVDQAGLTAQVKTQASPDAEALRAIGIDLDEVRRKAEESFGVGALDRPRRQRKGLFGHRTVGGGGHLRFNAEAKKSLEEALREAVVLRHNYIGTEHLLLGLLKTERGTALAILRRLGVTLDQAALRAQVIAELNKAA